MDMITLLFTIAYLVSWVFFHKNQFIERDNSTHSEAAIIANKRWHFWKGVNQIVFFSIMCVSFGCINALLCAVLYWIAFDSSMNKFVLNQGFFYVGKTSWVDRQTQSLAKLINVKASIVSASAKLTVLALVILKML